MDFSVVSHLKAHGLFEPFANTPVTEHVAYKEPVLTLSEQNELDNEILRGDSSRLSVSPS
jgi:hypothetical protein